MSSCSSFWLQVVRFMVMFDACVYLLLICLPGMASQVRPMPCTPPVLPRGGSSWFPVTRALNPCHITSDRDLLLSVMRCSCRLVLDIFCFISSFSRVFVSETQHARRLDRRRGTQRPGVRVTTIATRSRTTPTMLHARAIRASRTSNQPALFFIVPIGSYTNICK